VWIGPEDHAVVGQCLEAVRQQSGMTQTELARRLGKPQSFVSSYESGQRRIDLLEFLCIVAALGGQPERVFDEVRKRSSKIVRRVTKSRRSRD
jgi:transcriptional regulator with XRE-family HTH domain